jgi:hypothetical protein
MLSVRDTENPGQDPLPILFYFLVINVFTIDLRLFGLCLSRLLLLLTHFLVQVIYLVLKILLDFLYREKHANDLPDGIDYKDIN